MKIGELARLAGCKVVTVRYYEKEGLLDSHHRSEGNYRVYGQDSLERLLFIRRCRRHGMSLAEIRALLDYCRNLDQGCAWINGLVERHIASVDAQIAELQHLKIHLQELLRQCSGQSGGECGIVSCLRADSPCKICDRHPLGSVQDAG